MEHSFVELCRSLPARLKRHTRSLVLAYVLLIPAWMAPSLVSRGGGEILAMLLAIPHHVLLGLMLLAVSESLPIGQNAHFRLLALVRILARWTGYTALLAVPLELAFIVQVVIR